MLGLLKARAALNPLPGEAELLALMKLINDRDNIATAIAELQKTRAEAEVVGARADDLLARESAIEAREAALRVRETEVARPKRSSGRKKSRPCRRHRSRGQLGLSR